jgi:hypothetical protein
MKRIVSLIVAIAILTTCTLSVFAESKASIDAKNITVEIERTKDMVWEDLYSQLEAQDALDGIEYFKQALYPEIVSTVCRKYGVDPSEYLNNKSSSTVFYFPNGGLVEYEGDLNTENYVLCMTHDQTLVNSFTYDFQELFVDLVEIVLGMISGTYFWVLANLASVYFNATTRQAIADANYYSKILSISWGGGAESGSYAYAWSSHPYCTVYYNSITNVEYGN